MAQINMSSILAKAKNCMNSAQHQSKIEQKTDGIIMTGGVVSGGAGHSITIAGASMAAAKFIEVLQNEIRSLGAGGGYANGKLGGTAVGALTQLEHGSVQKIGKNKYQIEVWFADDLHRDSLAPDEYDGVKNIAALLNNGYSAGNTVYGTWHGNQTASITQRDGARFIESAIHNYMANYASEYGVINIEVADIYK